MKKTYHSRSAFTAVELVMVMAVTLILASVLVPVLLKGREMGRSTRCVANLKQLIQAVRMYVEEETSGRFPDIDPSNDLVDVMTLLYPYLSPKSSISAKEGKLEIFRCPTNFDALTGNQDSAGNIRQDNYGNRTDYGYNSLNLDNQVAQTRVKNPEWVSVLWDLQPLPGIHRGGSNIAFYDGHISWMSTQQMQSSHTGITPYNMWGLGLKTITKDHG
ncbi:MAG: type II secretion system protein [Chlamydiae bacterium]|nr:type II secretion system protein [Chlamydiota bacterium]MBI3276338.1 type II secretion system protein [Chlamydiota bacterium]